MLQLKGKTMLVADADGNMVEWEIISSHTKESIFQKSIPVLPPLAAAFFAFLNLVPGRSCSENIHGFIHNFRSRDFSCCLDSDLWRKIILWHKYWSRLCHYLDYMTLFLSARAYLWDLGQLSCKLWPHWSLLAGSGVLCKLPSYWPGNHQHLFRHGAYFVKKANEAKEERGTKGNNI